MQNDLIRRSDLRDAVNKICYSFGREEEVEGGVLIDLVEELPTVDAEVVRHGSWYYGECSVCKGICIHYKPPYCPNCGAKMDAEVEG